MVDLRKLNKEQKKAVTHSGGPLLIVAGAGTGKTTVITQRIAYLIDQGKAKPEEILGVTFTDKAAEEMEERVDWLLPAGYMDLWISTFHSFCERILRDHALDIGIPSDFKLLDQTGSWLLIRQNLEEFDLDYYKPLGNPAKFIHALISHFSRCKDQAIYPEEYLCYAENLKSSLTDLPEDKEGERIKEIANAFHAYQSLLLKEGYLDFGDLINYTLKLFQKRPQILRKFQNKFKYILVDEFQDTNRAQYELIKILTKAPYEVTVCADDDQAIYRWRGASYNNIIQFREDFSELAEVFLVRNYRSGQKILDLSYQFIRNNDPNRLECISKINKKLIAPPRKKGEIEYLRFKGVDEESKGVANKIVEIMERDPGASLNDFAVLVRANNSARPFVRALERARIPYQFLASRGLYSKAVILDIISYLRVLENHHENSAAYRVIKFPFLKIGAEGAMKISLYARKEVKSIYEALQEAALIPGLSEEAVKGANSLVGLIEKHAAMAAERNVSEILISFLQDSGYLKYLTSGKQKEKLELVNQFYKRIKRFEENFIDATLPNFIEQINLEIESGEEGKLDFDVEEGPEMVKIMTVHSAKGLEFKYVFIVGLVDRRFPTTERKEPIEIPEDLEKERAPEGDFHLEEERRLFYVAMTRAKEKIFFTSAEDYGGVKRKKASRFLIEMGLADKEEEKEKEKQIITRRNNQRKRRPKEKAVLPSYFSFSQLAAFEKCPLQYKFAHILRIPVRGKAVFSFGKTIHNTLHEFVRLSESKSGDSQTQLFSSKIKSQNNSFKDLMEIYKKQWIGEWYESKSQREAYFKNGKKLLEQFYQRLIKEKPEILKVNGNLALEIPFKIKIGEDILKGVIDRIDKAGRGARIVDYKTGKPKEKVSPEEKKQLFIYQLGAEEALGLQPTELSYYYLEGDNYVSFSPQISEKRKMRDEISKKIQKIKNSDFSPTPGWQCKTCDFKDICDYARK